MITSYILTDVKKMPLGKLSKTQIAKGFEALEEIQAAVESQFQQKFTWKSCFS